MVSSKNSNIKSGLKNQPTPTLDKEPEFFDILKLFFYFIIDTDKLIYVYTISLEFFIFFH